MITEHYCPTTGKVAEVYRVQRDGLHGYGWRVFRLGALVEDTAPGFYLDAQLALRLAKAAARRP